MPRNPSSTTHRGWAWDNDDSRLEVIVNGVEIGGFDSNGFSISGRGTVIQQTDKTTGVTLNNRAGAITMNGAALANAVEVVFTVTNSTVGANDVIIVNHASVGTSDDDYLVAIGEVSAGQFGIVVANVSAGSLSEAIVLNFVVIKVAA